MKSIKRVQRARLAAAALASLLSTGAFAQNATGPSVRDAGRTLAATGAGVNVYTDEVEELLLLRYGMAEDGLAILEMQTKIELLDELASDAGVSIGDGEVTRYWNDLDQKVRASGETRGLKAEIEARGMTVDEFRDYIERLIVQEKLARRALGIGTDEAITFDQQEVWLDQEIVERGLEKGTPPFDEGFVARCGSVVIEPAEFAHMLRRGLTRERVEEACWHLLLFKGIKQRMPDISAEAIARGVEEEIERRRAAHALEYPAISYEQRIGAIGRTIDSLRIDPSVHVAVLSRLWVDRRYGADGLRETFDEERDLFEGRFGASAHTLMLFKVAGRFVNELNKRTFETAERELETLRRRIGSIDDFKALAMQFSEEPSTRENGGELGWIHRNDGRIPREVREAVFDFVDAGRTLATGGQALDSVRLDTGCALLWIAGIRPSPPWETMAEHVHEELRRRFIVDVMPTGAMKILLYENANATGGSGTRGSGTGGSGR